MKNLIGLKYNLLLLISVFVCKITYSQKSLVDSINKYADNDAIKAKTFAYKLLKAGEQESNNEYIVKSLIALGEINNTLSFEDSAYFFFDRAIIKSYDADNEEMVLISKISKADFLYERYNFNEALKIYNEALSLAIRLENPEAQTTININIGRLKYEIGEYNEALNIFKQNRENTLIPKSSSYVIDYYLAKIYRNINKIDSSSNYIIAGLEKCRKLKDKEFEVPKRLVDFEVEQMIKQTEEQLERSGMNLEAAGLNKGMLAENNEPVAIQRVRGDFLLKKIALFYCLI